MSTASVLPRITVWTLLLILTPGRPAAQDTTRVWADAHVRFERVDGLSHNTVTALLQDHEGYLWIGTSDGLHQYDGYDFAVFRHRTGDATALSNNSVKALLEDRQGTLWVGTDAGLDRWDQRTGRFERFLLRPDEQPMPQMTVYDLLEDHRGDLWVATDDGLYRIAPQTGRRTAYRAAPETSAGLDSDRVWSLYEDAEQTFWVSTAGALHRYDPASGAFERFPDPEAHPYLMIRHEDAAGRLWLMDDQQSRAFDLRRMLYAGLPDLPPGTKLWSVLVDRNGVRWTGTDAGMYRDDPGTSAPVHVWLDPSPGAYLQNRVTTLYEDRAGILWVGTLSGLFHLDPHAKPFRHLGYDPTDPTSLSANTVMAVWEADDGILWVGTLGGGLNRVDRRTGTVTRYLHQPGRTGSLCHDRIWALYGDRRRTLWIGTDAGLCTLDLRTGRFAPHDLPLDTLTVTQPPIHALGGGRGGGVWVASLVGLYRIAPQADAVRRYARPRDDVGLRSSTFFVQTLYVDRAGAVWIGVFGGGLYRLDPATEAYTRYPLQLPGDRELASEGIWAIHEDGAGILWLGSDQGLTRLDPHSGAVQHVTQGDGLPGAIVYALLGDDDGRLWLSTNHGLARFDERLPADRRVRVYDAGDGLRNTEFNRRAAFAGADGTLFFGGLSGLTWFHPAAIRDNPVVPPVVLTRVEVSNRDSTVTVNPYGREELVLSYRDYTVSFDYAALAFTNPSRNRYRYRLDDFDEGWVEAGTERRARYTNIPPGAYVFRVIGSNNDGLWNEQGAALRLRITPPFWQTGWFRLLVIALGVGVLAAAYRYRVARLIAMERLRLRIAGDLHDDIGSSLSSIALLSDMVRGNQRLGARERRHLATISDSARSMVDLLRDIVWSIDPNSDRPGDLIRRMQETAAALIGDLQWTLDAPHGDLLRVRDMNTRRHLFLIYKEALHNAARHARATAVTIRIGYQDGALRLVVSDDGIGFKAGDVQAGNGLKSMTERAERIGGELTIRSQPGQGTTLVLTVKDGTLRAPRRSKRRSKMA